MNKTLKRYLISSAVTFVAVFLLALLPELSEFTLEGLKNGAIAGIVVALLRAGVKAGVEVIIPYLQSLLTK